LLIVGLDILYRRQTCPASPASLKAFIQFKRDYPRLCLDRLKYFTRSVFIIFSMLSKASKKYPPGGTSYCHQIELFDGTPYNRRTNEIFDISSDAIFFMLSDSVTFADIIIRDNVIYIDNKYTIVIDKNNPEEAITLRNLEKNRNVLTISGSGLTSLLQKKQVQFPLVFSFSEKKWEVFDNPISGQHPSGYSALFFNAHITSENGRMSVGENGHLGADKIPGNDIISIDKNLGIEVLSKK
jgi:hypothetical protein